MRIVKGVLGSLGALFLAFVLPAAAAADQAAADSAFDKGETARALTLYDEVLAADPANVHALDRTGRILLWQNWPKRALDRFERALQASPRDLTALEGRAEALAKIGAYDQSRRSYERSLEIEPARRESQIGLGWLDVWVDPPMAARRIRALEEHYPGDAAVALLRKASQRQWSPYLAFSYGHQSDNGGSTLDRSQLEGKFHLSNGAQLRFEAAHYDMEYQGQDARNNRLLGSVELGVGSGNRLVASAGFDDAKGGDQSWTPFVGSAAFSVGNGRRVRATLGASREVLLYNPVFLGQHITVDSGSANLSVRLTRSLSLEADGNLGTVDSLAGSSGRSIARGALTQRLLIAGRLPVDVSYALTYLDHEKYVPNGYWTPADSWNHSAVVSSSVWLPSGFGLSAQLSYGLQSYTDLASGAHVDGDRAFQVSGLASVPLRAGFALEGLVFHSRGSLQNPTGYNLTTGGVRLAWREKR